MMHHLRFANSIFLNGDSSDESLMEHIQGSLCSIPPHRGDGTMRLSEIIGATGVDEITRSGKIRFHLLGDTGTSGSLDRETHQEDVARAMALDYDTERPEHCPALFIHLGDVIYGNSAGSYLDQFYRPYKHYPGKIIAIPGNHDSDYPGKLQEFKENFCSKSQFVPPIAGSIFRETVNQPGVYWRLDAPFVDIIGPFSNSADNPGFISGPTIRQSQKNWLIRVLKTIKGERKKGVRKSLLFATHHPPYNSGSHKGSKEMLADIDDACKQAGLMPDALFSGHAHSIQRYSRSVKFKGKKLTISYVVSGCGGHGEQHLHAKYPAEKGDHVYEFGYKGYGYTMATISGSALKIESFKVETKSKSGDVKRKRIDSVTVRLPEQW